MISELSRLVDLVEQRLTDDLDVPVLARELATTEDHLRRSYLALAEHLGAAVDVDPFDLNVD